MVYHIAGGASDARVPLKHEEILEPIDGNIDKITVIDTGKVRSPSFLSGGSGCPVDPKYMPTRMKRKGNKGVPLHDVREIWGNGLLVSKAFKDIVESFQPNVHQFFPIAIEQSGEVIFERYYFHICALLDSLAKEQCVPPVESGSIYMPAYDGNDKTVFDSSKTAGHHAWHDERALGRYVSNDLFSELVGAELTGLRYFKYDEI